MNIASMNINNFNFPDGWNMVNIGSIMKESKEKGDSTLPLLSITRDRGVILQSESTKRDTSPVDKKKYKVLKPGYLVYNTMRMWQGVSAISEIPGVISPAYTVCIINTKKADARYIGYLFKQPSMINLFYRYSQGLVDDTLSIKYTVLEKLQILLPPLKEQEKIAEILSAADEQIEKNEQIIEKTKDLKNSLMQKLFSTGIGHSKFKEISLGQVPEVWKLVTLEEISKFITKGSTPTTYGYEWQDQGVFFFKSDVVKDGKFVYGDFKYISEEAHQQMLRSQIKAGDILMTITGNIGRVAVVPKEINKANINQHVARISVERKDLNPAFVFHWLSQPKFIQYYNSIKTGLAYPQISLKQVRETIIPIPAIEEQEKIANILSSVDNQIDTYIQEKEKQVELKKALMQQLLTGKIRVTV